MTKRYKKDKKRARKLILKIATKYNLTLKETEITCGKVKLLTALSPE